MDQWRVLVNRKLTFGCHKILGIYWVAESLAASQEGLRSISLVSYLVAVVPKYLNYSTFSKDLLVIFMLWIFLVFWWQYINLYLFFPALTPRPTSLPASVNSLCSFRYGIDVISQYIYVISTDQKLMCPILHFSPVWCSCIFLMAYSKAKLTSNGDKASPGFRQF
jgi:hypothetical protein